MKNIFLFIQRYFVFICFILLQIICIVLLSNSSKTHQAFFAGAANEVTGKINKRYYGTKEYLSLKETNKQLADENARLRNLVLSNFQVSDTTQINKIDSLVKDSLNRFRKYTFLPAKVVANTISSASNYIMLERGLLQGVRKDMSVVTSNGIVGIVVEVSDNYCKVMSLLHRNTKVSAMLLKNNISGDVEWDGADPNFINMKKVNKSAIVKIGDSVVTSTYSANYPSNIMIGTVVEIKPEKSSSFYNLKLKTTVNFFNLQYAYIIRNARFEEQQMLMQKKDVKNTNE